MSSPDDMGAICADCTSDRSIGCSRLGPSGDLSSLSKNAAKGLFLSVNG